MSFVQEYDAARQRAVIRAPAAAGTVVLTGADRRSFLHALLTNDIAPLTAGSGTYAAYLTPQGRMITDMQVLETGDRILLSVEPAVAASLATRLDRLIFSEDVQVSDASHDVAAVGIHGPMAASFVERVAGKSLAGLIHEYDNLAAEFDMAAPTATPGTIVRDDQFGMPGFDIYVPAGSGEALRARLAAAGALPASEETFETLRIESGRPRFGVDMTEDTIPLEAGIEDRAISFTKGCYVGQEVIIRVVHRGHGRVARRLIRLVVSAPTVPSRGDKVMAGDREVGEVTSAAASPKAGAPLAMAYVHRDYVSPDVPLSINGSKASLYQARD